MNWWKYRHWVSRSWPKRGRLIEFPKRYSIDKPIGWRHTGLARQVEQPDRTQGAHHRQRKRQHHRQRVHEALELRGQDHVDHEDREPHGHAELGEALAELLGPLQKEGARGQNLAIPLASYKSTDDVERQMAAIDRDRATDVITVTDEALEGLKFHACLPADVAHRLIHARLADPLAVKACLNEPIRFVRDSA